MVAVDVRPLKDARWMRGSDASRQWCITIPQPYAQLTVIGDRWCHDMPKPPPKEMIGKRIFVHAAQGKMTIKHVERAAQEDAEGRLGQPFKRLVADLPRRKIIGSVVLDAAFQIGVVGAGRKVFAKFDRSGRHYGEWGKYDNSFLHRWGDHSPGRWLWMFRDQTEHRGYPSVRGYSGLFDLATALHLEG